MGSMNDVKLVTDLHLALASQVENKLYREEFKFRETKSLKVEISGRSMGGNKATYPKGGTCHPVWKFDRQFHSLPCHCVHTAERR
jgi:hypothetical protein